jgi:UDP-N-acetylglucosamine--N-acetylmuramyl-(pentapeptide) pyrophosphoryl-undecaprenol N-acetylglucosamine transferase
MHILFAGGGTAGHINPALAVAGYIKERHPDATISYIGTERGLESRLVRESGYDFYAIEVAGFQRKLSLQNIKRNVDAVKKMFTSSAKAKKLLLDLKPDVVVGTGGYVSGPVLREAAKLKIRTCIHEQNAYPGVTTKALAGMVDTVMLAMPEAEKHLKCRTEPVVTGNPVRGSILTADRDAARKLLGVGNRPMILSFGGSLGARPINEAAVGLIAHNAKSGKYFHMHGTGRNGYDSTLRQLKERGVDPDAFENISVREYIDNMDDCLAAADLVICRSGAITLSELQNCGKPSILIPSPYVAENHQFHNAMTLKKCGAAEIIEEKDLTEESLISAVSMLIDNKQRLEQMGAKAKKSAISDANLRIYNVIMRLFTVA